MTNSYYHDPIEEEYYPQDDYLAEENSFYTSEASFAPPIKKDVWPERKLSRFFGTILWGVALIGFVGGTIWSLDILPVSRQQPTIVADSSTPAMKITPQKIHKEEGLLDPFGDDETNDEPSQNRMAANSAYQIDTPQNKAHRKRKMPAPNELLAYKTKTEQEWSQPEKDSRVVLASNEKTTKLIDPPRQLLPPENKKAIPIQNQQLDLTSIDQLLSAGKELEVHHQLSEIYWKQPVARPQIMSRLNKTARSIFISRQKHYTAPYVVQDGDQLAVIAQNYYVPWQYLARLNRTNPRSIQAGQKLKVIKGPFAAVIDLSDFELTIHVHGYYVKRYKIGIGKAESTPLGTFKVLNKLENPTYFGPNGKVIEADSPANPLGERWIDLGDSYGIHGTIDPNSIGKSKSRGCIRMLNNDVEEVYDFLGVGSVVKIQK